ncbi:hypothetical protein BGW38_003827 [Lunasporangiospora selenospora]|uniref:Lon N-terminal domain-containing protein n=1 Tax=Lunasporangiospora selenospora TaxID=979761 RepID=A0A9P6G0R1_9FUNG|nr:hypothetical protein BGW38_003827 [Lunasporangiospora selenospora]
MTLSFPTPSYRPLQCPLCKDLLLQPITFPCGFSLCQACLLPLTKTIDFQQQICCPFPACSKSSLHRLDTLHVDVTLQNLTTALRSVTLPFDRVQPAPSEPTPSSCPSSAPIISQTKDSAERTRGQANPFLANVLSEDTVNARDHHQPDTLYYGVAPDQAWDATLEGLYDPYKPKPVEPLAESARTTTILYRNIALIIDSIRSRIQQEIECQVCFMVFHDPLTTICGHTLCKNCFITSLDHNPNCPLCRQSLSPYQCFFNHPPNKALVRFIQYLGVHHTADHAKERGFLHDESLVECRTEEPEINPELTTLPLFVNSLILPPMPCYLLVFESRYRKLLRNVLKTESKTFGMVLPPKPQKGQESWEPSMEYGTLLKILSYEFLPDGRALVETIGQSRFQILKYTTVDEYYAATAIELIEDIPSEHEDGLERAALEAIAEKEARAMRSNMELEGLSLHETGLYRRPPPLNGESGSRRSSGSSLGDALAGLDLTELDEQRNVTHLDSSASTTQSHDAELSTNTPRSVALGDLHELDLETLSRKELMELLLAFVSHMQDRLGPLAIRRLQREVGEMVEDDGQYFSFWMASILPIQTYQKYEILKVTSVRQRLLLVLGWIKDCETRRAVRSMAGCVIS